MFGIPLHVLFMEAFVVFLIRRERQMLRVQLRTLTGAESDPDSLLPLSYPEDFAPSSDWGKVCVVVVLGGENFQTGSDTSVICLVRFGVAWGYTGESDSIEYSTSEPLYSSSTASFCIQVFSFRVADFLDGVATFLPRFKFNFGGMVPVGHVLVTMN